MNVAQWVEVARATDIPPGHAARVEIDGIPVAIFNVDGDFYALDDTCSHAEASLILVRPAEQAEVFRLLTWQQSDEIWLLPACDLVRIVQRMSILGAFPKDVEKVVPWSDVARALGDLPRQIASDPDVNFISAQHMPEARHRLGRLSGRPFARYQRVRPDHCIEVPLG